MRRFFSDSNEILASATERVAPHLEMLLAEHPGGLRALLAQWQALACREEDPHLSQYLDQALEHLDPEQVLEQVLNVERLDIAALLVQRGCPLGQARIPEAQGSDVHESLREAFGPIEPRHEPFLVARMSMRHEDPSLGLAALARLDPERPGCLMLPAAGADTSWLALALFSGQREQAEQLWADRQASGVPWRTQELAEAALAWLANPFVHGVSDETMACWWDRLMVPGVVDYPVPVKQGWSRLFEPSSRLRMNNLKEHLEGALRQSMRQQTPDMLGVLVRTLALPTAQASAPTLRPVDMLLRALTQIPVEPGAGQPLSLWLDRVQALDWGGFGPDGFGRPLALEALELDWASARNENAAAPVYLIWPKLLHALAPAAKDLWWSMACTMAVSGHHKPMLDAWSFFKGRYPFSAHEALLVAAAQRVKKARQATPPREAVSRVRQCAHDFWEIVVPCLERTSTPEAAAQWQQLRAKAQQDLLGLDGTAPASEKAIDAIVLGLSLPTAPIASARPRM